MSGTNTRAQESISVYTLLPLEEAYALSDAKDVLDPRDTDSIRMRAFTLLVDKNIGIIGHNYGDKKRPIHAKLQEKVAQPA